MLTISLTQAVAKPGLSANGRAIVRISSQATWFTAVLDRGTVKATNRAF
jgi:hypothetical protein